MSRHPRFTICQFRSGSQGCNRSGSKFNYQIQNVPKSPYRQDIFKRCSDLSIQRTYFLSFYLIKEVTSKSNYFCNLCGRSFSCFIVTRLWLITISNRGMVSVVNLGTYLFSVDAFCKSEKEIYSSF